jgi:3alpha(or 20beta)-hydroxysteroid dehydrogenase
MSKRFNDRTVIITGAVGALGETLVKQFAAEGANVVIAARRKKEGAQLAEETGEKALFVTLDVTDEVSWSAAIAATEARFGAVSVLINNAAYLAVGSVEQVPLEEWKKVIDTNLTGSLLGIRAVAPSMRKAGGGSIVNVSSIAGLHATPHLAAYGASKWALRGLTKTAAYELAHDRIRVNAVHPGIIETPLAYDPVSGQALVPVDKFAIPRNASTEEIAKYILFVASEDAAFSTASEFVADGGFALGPIAV